MSSTPHVKPGYRSEIQGLRGVAILLIMGYHIWVGKPSGGIDIFIMLSGFFAIGSQSKITDGPRVRLRDYLAKLLKRLLPNALFVISLITLAVVTIMPKLFWYDTLKEIFASIFYFENWQLAVNSRDYLAAGNRVSPLQHFWSLSIQGQLYILFFVLMSLTILLARKLKSHQDDFVLAVVSVVCIVSFIYANIAVSQDQSYAYFNTFARVWEFGLGGLVALVTRRVRHTGFTNIAIGWIGIAGIVSCGALLNTSKLFPGYATLWPTVCTALLLISTQESMLSINRILRLPPFVYVGNISYALFLWHWPVLIFFLIKTDREHAGFVGGLFIIAVSFVGGILTTRFIEGSFTQKPLTAWMKKIGSLRVALALTLIVTLFPGAVYGYVKSKQHPVSVTNNKDYPGARALEKGFVYEGADNVEVIPNLFNVRGDVPVVYENNLACIEDSRGLDLVKCTYGSKHPEKVIALVGGSYSAHWLPALQEILHDEPTWQVVTYLKSSCPLSLGFEKPSTRKTCEPWNEKVIDDLSTLHPDLVFTTSTRSGYSDGNDEVVPESYEKSWKALDEEGIAVIALRDVPRRRYNLSECVAIHGYSSDECISNRSDSLAAVDPTIAIAQRNPNVYFADLTMYICPEEKCKPVVGNVLTSRDHAHMTSTFSRTLAPFLKSSIDQAFLKLKK